ncbi:hypothetical protein F511_23340 [Dorcoceras hygrometricum]|uniref:Uncharacterized protein n=1 Tax=Dorcoceras hygrometricum TaxID=472368 RepID=A0A2Z7AAP0_9LAMI|nr:hypothetical protein F511_23340 [Dorcoceras hygrometricum]
MGPQPLRLRNHNSGLAQRIMVKRLATSPHDPLGITDSACKNQSVMVSVQYGPFNPYIPIRSTTIGKSRVAIDPIAMHTSWRSNSDIASVTRIGYPRMSASGESSTTMHRLLHASGSHPIPTLYDPKRVGKRVKYNQDLGLIHSTNGNHLESPKEGRSIDHQVTIYLHAQNFTMFHTNETWKHLENVVDGLEIKMDVLESTLACHSADNQQHIAALETSLVHHYADSQKQLVDELALVKSQLAEMVECIKELRDAKRGKLVKVVKRVKDQVDWGKDRVDKGKVQAVQGVKDQAVAITGEDGFSRMDLEEAYCAKKRSSYICPAVGSQYIDSAVGLVFMESAVELAMETSRVISAVHGEQHGRSRKTNNNMPWFERITVRVISPTIHGLGYRPLSYELLVVGQRTMPQNLNFRPSGNVDLYDVFSSHQSSAGPSAPSYVYDIVMSSGPSSVINTIGPSGYVDPYDVFASHQSSAGPYAPSHVMVPEIGLLSKQEFRRGGVE